MTSIRAKHWRKHLVPLFLLRRLYKMRIENVPTDNVPDATDISLDVPRTFPKHKWFSPERRHTLKTMLLQWASVNRGDGYVQGMNSILGVCMYVYCNEEENHYALADAWWTFSEIVNRVRPVIPDFNMRWFNFMREDFVKKLKKTLVVYKKNLWKLLEPHISSLSHLIMVRWIMIWFSHNFSLKDVVIIWDALFMCERRQLMDLYVAISVAILSQASPTLFSVQSSEIPRYMMDYRATKPRDIILRAKSLL